MNRTTGAPKAGFTLAEVLIATSLTALLMAGMTSSFMFIVKSSFGMGNYVDMNNQSRNGLEKFGRDARMTISLRYISENTYYALCETAQGRTHVAYWYDWSQNAFMRWEEGAGAPQAVLKDVRELQFKYYNLAGNATTALLEAKQVQVDAGMVRHVFAVENTNHVISARFMMRNRDVAN